MKNYIITADDYGLCPEVDEAIEKLALGGYISTTNVLMNFGTDFSKSPLRGLENFSLGLHWNVTTGRPLCDPTEVPTLVDSEGRFYSLSEFRRRCRRRKINKQDLAKELRRQYEAYEKAFGQPEYWNTHENSALYPWEYKVFSAIALEKGIRATRNFQRVYVDYDLAAHGLRRVREFIVKSYINFKFGWIERKRFAMPDARIVTFRNISKTDVNRMRTALDGCRKGTVEIIIHPSTSGENALFGNIGNDRVLEYETYGSEPMHSLFLENGSRIVDFSVLESR